jgi:ribosomal protein L11 methyltransferase
MRGSKANLPQIEDAQGEQAGPQKHQTDHESQNRLAFAAAIEKLVKHAEPPIILGMGYRSPHHITSAAFAAIRSREERSPGKVDGTWLKYTLHVASEVEEAFVADVLDSSYTLGWVEPQIEVLVTDNGYDYKEKTELPVVVYLFEPMTESEERHVERLQSCISRWPEHVRLESVERVKEENDSWKEEFREVQVGDWWIAPTWTAEERLAGVTNILRIDPGAAFGTGYHGTTQDMIRLMQQMNLNGKLVLDIGAGSGILSLFAVMRGAKQPVWAVDINPQTEYHVQVNLANNGLPPSAVRVVIGDPLERETGDRLPQGADLILLNIGGEEDVAMLPVVLGKIAPGGTVILSGIVEWNRDKVLAAYEQAGFRLTAERQSEEWITLMLCC